jgi:2-oxo-4-hydroxy-4-carboxy--5-ureidoimidazoline (OHCU) decarboxylase
LPELGQGRAWICDVTANKLAIQRVRELAERYNRENLVTPFPDMAKQILAALDGDRL